MRASDGSALWWGGRDMPALPTGVAPNVPVVVKAAVAPMRPGHTLIVEHRVNGGPVRQTVATMEPRRHDSNIRVFRATLPGQTGGLVEFLPVLCFAGQPISRRLSESADHPRYQVRSVASTAETPHQPASPVVGAPRWNWNSRFLGACTIALQKEVVGDTPEGLRIIWRFADARFAGPILEGAYLPGAADWMHIRPDGVAIVQVQGCIETPRGARIYTSYGGYLELGREGYARAQRGDFDLWPPFVCAATYATADKNLEWLNRAQCLILGRVNMKALKVESDVYLVEVGGRTSAAAGNADDGGSV
ncbi:MAG TPA: DUF3237 domain-containing protein [Terriglobia bacterium]|nr:DUF3237 domain-containing protein [Terriglobia bacterium]